LRQACSGCGKSSRQWRLVYKFNFIEIVWDKTRFYDRLGAERRHLFFLQHGIGLAKFISLVKQHLAK